ncbi:LysR family transcriptional regulator [Martelella alba]|uniref:LysR family transcriptional regulator n=1 Tax=Martelella alba TaxID=2590451 RepID=A0ABY2SMU1_9HYPH|nr:LysR family transcriptional regulator [Martelella alba]TKI07181.1 LysR family transcriptional regulator [Martelella alba]
MRNLTVYRYIDAIARTGSIRKAAETLAITPSALNRRVLALEEELGVPLFERLGNGVRLNTAGELIITLFRRQLAEVERLKSQLADLSGLRRGHVSVVCSQALLPYFLPRQIHLYQALYPGVTFRVHVRDGEAAGKELLDYSADFALLFEPLPSNDFLTILTVKQPVHAVMSQEHPLAIKTSLKLSECVAYPLAMPSAPYALHSFLRVALAKISHNVEPTVEADSYVFLRNFAAVPPVIAFELQIGAPPELIGMGLVSIPVELGEHGAGHLHLIQLKGRALSVAAARFLDQLGNALSNLS